MKKTTIGYVAVWCVCFVLLVLVFFSFNLRQLDIASMLFEIFMVFLLILTVAQFIYSVIKTLMKSSQKLSVEFWRRLFISAWFFFLIGFEMIPLSEIMYKKARVEIINTIKQMNPGKITVSINGKETKQKAIVLEALQQLQSMDNKGGRPPVGYCVISDGEKILLLKLTRNNIIQDHIYDYSYLVYYPKYVMTKSNPIGGFFSKSLDLENP
jgi:hypothetical protein